MNDVDSERQKKSAEPVVDVSYSQILFEIRNMNVLSSRQMARLTLLSNDQLLKIIEIYNIIMRNVNEII
jgi:hypothetical protein